MREAQLFRVLLVPSGEIRPVNSLEGTSTLARCKKALELWKSTDYEYVVASGARCHNAPTETQPAATTMGDWFVSQGVNPEAVWREKHARDTFENVKYTLKLLRTKRIDNFQITVVTSTLHGIRVATIARVGYGITLKRAKVLDKEKWLLELLGLAYTYLDPKGIGRIAEKIRITRTFPESDGAQQC